MRMIRGLTLALPLVVALGANQSLAADTGGCEAFAWSLKTEIGWITAADRLNLKSGEEIASVPDRAIILALVPQDAAALAAAPSGTPKSAPKSAHAGVLKITNVAKAGKFQVTLGAPGWIDVIQGGAALADVEHTGIADCPHARKSVRFDFKEGPAVIQVSGAAAPEMVVTIRAAD